jgi:hypothetical protein
MAERRPSHETIVDQLGDSLDRVDLERLGWLITATKIPKNHDAIIEAWKAAGRKLEADETFISRVADDILEQKKEAEAEAAAKEAKEQKKVTGFVRKECWELLRQEPARAVCFTKRKFCSRRNSASIRMTSLRWSFGKREVAMRSWGLRRPSKDKAVFL